jgi:tetratricopeptide (TPR) repeat protein
MGGFPMGGPPMGGMMAPPRFGPGLAGRPGPGPMPGGLGRPSPGPRGMPGGMGPGRPPGGAAGIGGGPGRGPGLNPMGAGRPPGFPGDRPPLGSRPAGVAPARAGGGPANLARGGAGGRPEPGRDYNPRHADWYRGGWDNSRGGTGDKGRDSAAWDKARDYVREERARDYAAGLAWGLGGWGSSDYGSGSGSGSGYDSGSGYGYGYDSGSGSGYSSGYGTGYSSGYGTGSGDAYANTSSEASSTDSDSSRTDAAQETKSDLQQDGAAAEQGDQKFDRARDAFKAGDYAAALDLTDAALKDLPADPLVHEFKGVVLFARGEYAQAAAEIHTVLAVRTGMDWTTLIGLYPDVETYTGQLRALEDRCRREPKAEAPRFVLAYHYLVAGHKDAAVTRLKELLALEPGDRVAGRLLASLTGIPPASPEPARTAPDGDGAAGRPPSADLAGRWRGEHDGSTFDLSLDDRGRFLWRAARQGKATATVSGAYALSGDTLTLKGEDRSPLRASLTERSPDSFRFKPVAGAPSDPGLVFRRAAMPAAPARDR